MYFTQDCTSQEPLSCRKARSFAEIESLSPQESFHTRTARVAWPVLAFISKAVGYASLRGCRGLRPLAASFLLISFRRSSQARFSSESSRLRASTSMLSAHFFLINALREASAFVCGPASPASSWQGEELGCRC